MFGMKITIQFSFFRISLKGILDVFFMREQYIPSYGKVVSFHFHDGKLHTLPPIFPPLVYRTMDLNEQGLLQYWDIGSS
jgi:hypothetical protein